MKETFIKNNNIYFFSILLCYSLVLSYIENILPGINSILPGIKIGISNIITVIIIYFYDIKNIIIFIFIKILFTAIFINFAVLPYNIAGSILSVTSMYILNKYSEKYFTMVGISIVGSFLFNIGQFAVASIIIKDNILYYYIPYISFVSILTGFITGKASEYVIVKLSKNKTIN